MKTIKKYLTTTFYLAIILLILAFFFSCKNKNEILPYTTKPSTIVVIDSCEYIYFNGGIAHMGNCQYCKQRSIRQIESEFKLLQSRKNN